MTNKVAVGIDPGFTGTGLVVLSNTDGLLYSDVFESINDGTSDFLRARIMANSVTDWIMSLEDVDVIVIEGFSMNSRFKGVTLAILGTLIRNNILEWCNYPLLEIAPTALKVVGTGKGNASKEQMIAAAQAQGFNTTSEHLADAYFLAKAGLFSVNKSLLMDDNKRFTAVDTMHHVFEKPQKFI